MSDADNPSRPLANRGFLSLVITQFFGVVNDNLLKQVLTFGLAAAGVWSGVLGDGGQSWVAMALVQTRLRAAEMTILRMAFLPCSVTVSGRNPNVR